MKNGTCGYVEALIVFHFRLTVALLLGLFVINIWASDQSYQDIRNHLCAQQADYEHCIDHFGERP